MTKGIYIIQDTLANQALGGPLLFAHNAAAVRFFADIASNPESAVFRYLEDHQLVRVATFNESECKIEDTEFSVVITGAAWKAAQNPEGTK